MPGKRVTDHQVIKYKLYRRRLSQEAAAAKVGISERTARRLDRLDGLPSQRAQRTWRTRSDPLTAVWGTHVLPMLRAAPGLTAVTVLEELQRYHGGPEGQERPVFRGDYQALLSRGISVLAPNVRGSSGFGKRCVNLENGALRVDAVRDIEATIDWLVSSGIADPKKIGIMGGSYGGYMVMAGLTEYPTEIAAGANLFGVVNFATFFANSEPWMAAISTIEYGDPDTQADILRNLSPLTRIDRVVAPTREIGARLAGSGSRGPGLCRWPRESRTG